MPKVLISIILFVFSSTAVYAFDPDHVDCQKKEDICMMVKTMSHFAILDQCPAAAPFLADCKKVSSKSFEPLPAPEFVANGDGTVLDTKNNLVWMKSGDNEKLSLKDAMEHALNSEAAGKTGWRVPTLRELSSLLQNERVENAGGKTGWVHPLFDDTGEYYYWTTTTCEDITVITDRYQEKICQQGPGGAWLVNFKAGAIIWHFVESKKFYVWLVRDGK